MWRGNVLSPELRYSFDGLDLNTVVVATYFIEIEGSSDVISRVHKISSLIYPGAWTETVGDAAEALEKHAPRILGIYETPPYELELPRDLDRRRFVIQLAMPLIDLDQNLASLLTSIGGEILAYGNIKLLDVYLPESYVAGFAGPRFGVAGIRRLLGVNERPLLMAIVKPSKGYSPEVGASAFFEAACGGVDIVKDEELLMDPGYCRRARRVELYMNAEKRAYEETGEHTLYAVNITDQVDRLLPNALEAIELGANALMVNYMHVGLEATRMLCTDPRITVPVLGHNSGVTSMLAGTHTGISAVLINGKLPRLAGIDMAIVLSGFGSFPILWERCLLLIREMLSPLYAIDPILPLVANGVTPGRVGRLVGAMGNEVALGAGSAIFGHPQGPAAGARAFRQAIQVAADGQDAANAAEDQPELAEALKLWGGD